MRSLALTAARQISDGSEHDADDAVINMQCAKAQLAAALPMPEQFKHIRKRLNRLEDDMQATTDQREAATNQFREPNAKSRQLTNISDDLREELSESDAGDGASDDRRPRRAARGSSARSAAPRPRRRRGHVGAPSPELDHVTALWGHLRCI